MRARETAVPNFPSWYAGSHKCMFNHIYDNLLFVILYKLETGAVHYTGT